MFQTTTDHTQRAVDRLLHGPRHPVVAIVSFFAAFLFAAIPFLLDTDHFYIVAACLTACFSSAILFLRLLIGHPAPVKFLLATAALLSLYAGYGGSQWYFPLILAGGTVFCSYFLGRLIGDFSPLIRGVKYW